MPSRRDLIRTLLGAVVALGARATVAQSAPIPFEYDDARVWVPVRVGDAAPRWFILDTGAFPTIVDRDVARTSGLAVSGETTQEGAGRGQMVQGRTTVPTLAIGDVRIASHGASVAPLDSVIGPFTGRAVPGIVGSRFFANHVVALDFARRTVRMLDARTYRPPSDALVVPLDIRGDIPYARATLTLPDGSTRPMDLLVDLGAKATLLVAEHFVDAQRLPTTLGPGVIGTLGAGIGGETRYRFVRVPRLSLATTTGGSVALDGFVAGLSVDGTIRQRSFDALLGVEFLSRYDVVLDYPGKRLVLRPRAGVGAPAEFDMAGLYVIAPRGARRVRVLRVLAGGPADVAGVREGDALLAVDGMPLAASGLGALREVLRSAPGRTVRLRLERGGAAREVTLQLRRLV